MTIFKYTFIKYMKSWSTWVILLLSLVISGVVGGYLPFQFINTDKTNSQISYAIAMIGVVSALTSFLSIFVSVFAGFKSAQMFKDEVEDGTFLVILSKPLTRGRIIFFKWLSLQTLMLLFTLLTTLGFTFAVLLFDNGDQIPNLSKLGINTISSKIWPVSLIIWGVLILFGLIFSSISLLLSTRLSTGTTIGIAIGIGVVIPITGLVSTFTRKPEWEQISNTNLNQLSQGVDILSKVVSETDGADLLKADIDNVAQSLSTLYDQATLENGAATIGLATNENDGFEMSWYFDINFQVQTLSTYASDIVIPDVAQEIARQDAQQERIANQAKIKKKKDLEASTTSDSRLFNIINNLSAPLATLRNDNWALLQKIAQVLPLSMPTFVVNLSGERLFALAKSFAYNVDNLILTNQITPLQPGASDPLSALYQLNAVAFGQLFSAIDAAIKDPYSQSWTAEFIDANLYNNPQDVIVPQTGPGPDLGTNVSKDAFNDLVETISGYDTNNSYSWGGNIGPTYAINELFSTFYALSSDMIKNYSSNNEVGTLILSVASAISLQSDLLRPLTRIIYSSSALNQYFQEHEATQIPIYAANEAKALNLLGGDTNFYISLASIDDAHPDNIVFIESVKYVNRTWIFIVYLIVALLLVPISYLTIRKQDYR